MGDRQTDQQYTKQETAHRRDAVLLRALKTPPKPHKEMVGKGKKTKDIKNAKADK